MRVGILGSGLTGAGHGVIFSYSRSAAKLRELGAAGYLIIVCAVREFFRLRVADRLPTYAGCSHRSRQSSRRLPSC